MCRLAAFPPGFPRMEALEILLNFENQNTDGTGSAFVKDGKFIVEKYPKSLSYVLKKKPFLGHMPYNGWTITHLRAASHGEVCQQNTHPFVADKWAMVHNGMFSEYELVRLALGKVEFEGTTDSEVTTHLLSVAGPKKFSEHVDLSGVFLALNKNGHLLAIKTSGDLEMIPMTEERTLLASEFDGEKFPTTVTALYGWYHFDQHGRYIKHKKQRESYCSYHPPIPARIDYERAQSADYTTTTTFGPNNHCGASHGNGCGRPLPHGLDEQTMNYWMRKHEQIDGD